MEERAWIDLGRTAILDLLANQHAAPWLEIEARVEHRWLSGRPVEPHILTLARRELRDERVIATNRSPTRGGTVVPILYRTDLRRRKTAIEDAAARKRLLYARHQSWAASTERHRTGLIGGGGETVVHTALLEAAPLGFKLARPESGSVGHLLGQSVPGGPLDNAAYLLAIDEAGIPQSPVVLPIEVKNVRSWLYSNSAEVFQVLYKAAAMKRAHPNVRILPVLVCRRRHYRTFEMGRDLGFFVIEMLHQVVLPHSDVDDGHFEEVRTELGYADLLKTREPPEPLRKALAAIPTYALANEERWALCAPALHDHFAILRDTTVRGEARRSAMNAMRADALTVVSKSSVAW